VNNRTFAISVGLYCPHRAGSQEAECDKKMCKNKLPCGPGWAGRDVPLQLCLRTAETDKPVTPGDVERRTVASEDEVIFKISLLVMWLFNIHIGSEVSKISVARP